MNRLMTQTQHELLKLRQRIEGIFSCLKHRLKAEAFMIRSPLGYRSRCLYACLTFALSKELEIKILLP
ncbi:MAG: hypothetical protein NC930_01330 [Candidatus Omnitrophica bacterium]|nr:hypothetical protein [Candidatus Omnitrophota bacterium]